MKTIDLIKDSNLLFFLKKINVSQDWWPFFIEEWKKSYFQKLLYKIFSEYENFVCYPSQDKIFRAFRLTSFQKVKVIIIGQDPYHQPHQADGLAFSVSDDSKRPKSLINIFKELINNFPDKGPVLFNDLYHWAQQGVLLLNTLLTVRQNEALSHLNIGWEIFTNNILKYLDKKKQILIFVFWGAKAKKKQFFLTNKNHYSFFSAHPSPFSAHYGFFGSNIFKKINSLLKSLNSQEINWFR